MARFHCPVFLNSLSLDRRFRAALFALATAAFVPPAVVSASEPSWIWSHEQMTARTVAESAYFRKTFTMQSAEEAVIEISADSSFTLLVNGREVGSAKDWKRMQRFDLKPFLLKGKNVVAVQAEKNGDGPAALVARLTVREQGGTFVAHSTDRSWKVSSKHVIRWEVLDFDDSSWQPARELGELGATAPWTDQVRTATGQTAARFTVMQGFRIEEIASPKETGSLLALAFDEQGRIVISSEGGGLAHIVDGDKDGVPDTVQKIPSAIKNAQGILPLNGEIFAVGDGPQGLACYRMSKSENATSFDQLSPIVSFEPTVNEHGPHGLALGPDGLLYLSVGNHTKLKTQSTATSPYRYAYEADSLPKQEDPGGHAVGIKAPGGSVLRTDTEGSFLEIYAGGIRNAYDLAFNREGELFLFDSDMEWDKGTPWYRPTRISHIISGADLGWRSGWSKFPEYCVDSLPPALNVGPGSPTGITVYNHFEYPPRFHNSLFACDWSRGRILHIRLRPTGGGYVGSSELFVAGRPLNVTDIAVGPDGALYFCTGGRGTEGGVFRVVALDKAPDAMRKLGTGIEAALRQPQPESAWGQRSIMKLKEGIAADWDSQIIEAARSTKRKPAMRAQALRLMQLYGPFPTAELLMELSRDFSVEVRAQSAYLMGMHGNEQSNRRLNAMLKDASPIVRRMSCEALARAGAQPSVVELLELLKDEDRYVAWSAQKALQALPTKEFLPTVLQLASYRVFARGSLAALALKPSPKEVAAILARAQQIFDESVPDNDFVEVLRVLEVIVAEHGAAAFDEWPEFKTRLVEEFPAGDERINRLLCKVIAALSIHDVQATEPQAYASCGERMIEYLESEASHEARLQVALAAAHFRHITFEQRLTLLRYLRSARTLSGGYSYTGYLENAERKAMEFMTEEEKLSLLAGSQDWPEAALQALVSMAKEPSAELLKLLPVVDSKLRGDGSDAREKLKMAIIAVLGQSGQAEAMAYLRETFEKSPDRRPQIAMGLAQQPSGENWPLLLRSLSVLEGLSADEVLRQLAKSDAKPTEPEPIRQTILLAHRLGENGQPAHQLLAQWTGASPSAKEVSAADKVRFWQNWYTTTYPDSPSPMPAPLSDSRSWTTDEILGYLSSSTRKAPDLANGALVYDKAKCANCHQMEGRGKGIAPDLTTIGARFHPREIVDSILYPSHVISDQYATRRLTLQDGRVVTGMFQPGKSGVWKVLLTSGDMLEVQESEISEMTYSKVSAMPEGLLNDFKLEEVGDLIAFLTKDSLRTAAKPK